MAPLSFIVAGGLAFEMDQGLKRGRFASKQGPARCFAAAMSVCVAARPDLRACAAGSTPT